MIRHTLHAVGLGVLGAALATAIGMPAPLLTGPAACVAAAAVAGIPSAIPMPLRHACFLMIGLGLGTGVTPEVLADAVKWPASLIAMVLSVATIMGLGGWVMRRGFGCGPRTALLAATPGHLSFVLGLSLQTGADVALVSVVQSLRVLMLTLLVPAAVAIFTGAEVSLSPPASQPMPVVHLAGLAAGAIAVGAVFLRYDVPAAFLLSGMFVSVAGHGSGVTAGVIPHALSAAAFVTIGTLIGTRFTGTTLAQIRRGILGAAVLTAGGFLVVLLASLTVVALVDLPLVDVVIALAPGGLETMIAMSAVIGADPAFVGFHHLARMFLLSALVPLALARLPLADTAPPKRGL